MSKTTEEFLKQEEDTTGDAIVVAVKSMEKLIEQQAEMIQLLKDKIKDMERK